MTDIEGEVFQHTEYFPFGETWVEEHSNRQRTPYLFTGKELDEDTQLYYFGARYYDPRTSVWQSPDPILKNYLLGFPAGGVYIPTNLNAYGYAHQRPVIANDPEGKWINFVIGGVKGAVENVIIQHAEMAVGLRDEFSWGELAVDSAIGVVTSGTGGSVKTAARAARVADAARSADKADDAVDAARMAGKADDAADIAQDGVRQVDNATEAGGGKTYQTYTKTNEETGQVYCGRTSGCGTPRENVAARDANHHKNDDGFGPAVLDQSSSNKDAIRGREQQLIDANGGAQSQGGTSGNAIQGIADTNAKRDSYLDAANAEFGPM